MNDDVITTAEFNLEERPKRRRASAGVETMSEPKYGDKIKVRVPAATDPALRGKERCRQPVEGVRRYFTNQPTEVVFDQAIQEMLLKGNIEIVE